jgi:hypothetical protein
MKNFIIFITMDASLDAPVFSYYFWRGQALNFTAAVGETT